ncbi:hypothetical protein C9890_0143 [Perkinsus sp. BL_2016]|nr:hypothetical protein C9890_0143 [Perkinsus sp. BL_2016]
MAVKLFNQYALVDHNGIGGVFHELVQKGFFIKLLLFALFRILNERFYDQDALENQRHRAL